MGVAPARSVLLAGALGTWPARSCALRRGHRPRAGGIFGVSGCLGRAVWRLRSPMSTLRRRLMVVMALMVSHDFHWADSHRKWTTRPTSAAGLGAYSHRLGSGTAGLSGCAAGVRSVAGWQDSVIEGGTYGR